MTEKKRRRRHGEGSIYRRTDGCWCSVADLGYINGKRVRKTVSGKTRKEVADKLPAFLTAQQQGMALPTSTTKVSEFLTLWLEEAVKPTNAARTHESYSQLIEKHISAMIGRHHLDKLTRSHVQQMLNAKTEEGLSGRTVQYLWSVLRMALNAALAEPPRQNHDEVTPLTADQIRTLFREVSDDRLEAIYIVAGTLGLRKGECMGLRWSDIDFEIKSMTVRKQVQRINGREQLVDLKTQKSRRTLPLPDVVVKGLRRRQEREKQDITLAGSHWRGDEWGLVFPSTIGTPLNGSNILQQLRGHLDRAGLLAFDFKTLRHTAATTLAMQGVPTRTAMAILGHSQMATTTDVYSHVIEDSMRTAVDSVELAYQPKAVAKRPVLKRRRSALPTTHKASKGAS